MSGLAGSIRLRGASDGAQDEVERMLASMQWLGPDGQAMEETPAGVVGRTLWANTEEAMDDAQPVPCTGGFLLFDGLVDHHRALCAELDLPEASPDSTVFAAGWSRWGADLVQRISGEYAAAHWNPEKKELHLIADHMALRPLYWSLVEGRVAFATDVGALVESIDWIPKDVDEDRVRDWKYGVYGCPDNTFFLHIKQVGAGTVVRISADGVEPHQYWSPEKVAVEPGLTYEDGVARVRSAMREAVRDRMRAHGGLASHLSGGLDSTSVAALAASMQEARLDVYSFRLQEPMDDDPFIDRCQHEMAVRPHMVMADLAGCWSGVEGRVQRMGGPHLSLFMGLAEELAAAAAKNGVKVMLTGSEGDEVIGAGTAPSAQRHLRAIVGRPVAGLHLSRRRAIRGWVGSTTKTVRNRWKARVRSRAPMKRPATYAYAPVTEADLAWYWDRALRFDAMSMQSLWSEDQFHRRVLAAGTIRHIALAVLRSHQVHGIEPRFPMFARDLVEACLAIPGRYRLRGGRPRQLIRDAMDGILPDFVRLRDRKGMPPPSMHIDVDWNGYRDEMETAARRWASS